MKLIQDDKGNISSLRVILLIIAVIQVWLVILFSLLVFAELHKFYYYEHYHINYTGLAALFTVLVGQILLAVASKVLQKKYECRG